MTFCLPIAALPEVRSNVPPEQFQNAVSVSDVMKTAIQSDLRPRWLWRKRE
jgi:hypothetical protein